MHGGNGTCRQPPYHRLARDENVLSWLTGEAFATPQEFTAQPQGKMERYKTAALRRSVYPAVGITAEFICFHSFAG
jgi:hypothetical protein